MRARTLLLVLLSSCAQPPRPMPAPAGAPELALREVSAPAIASHVRFLADDSLEGRAPGSRGSELAIKYVAAQYERMGLVPAGDAGSYLQRFTIVGLKTRAKERPILRGPRGTLTLDPAVDAVVAAGSQK